MAANGHDKTLRDVQACLVHSLQNVYRRPFMYELTPPQLEILIRTHMIVLAESWELSCRFVAAEKRVCEKVGASSLNLASHFARINPNAEPKDVAEFIRSVYAQIASTSGLLARIVREGLATKTFMSERVQVHSAPAPAGKDKEIGQQKPRPGRKDRNHSKRTKTKKRGERSI